MTNFKIGDKFVVTTANYASPYDRGSIHTVERIIDSWVEGKPLIMPLKVGEFGFFESEIEVVM